MTADAPLVAVTRDERADDGLLAHAGRRSARRACRCRRSRSSRRRTRRRSTAALGALDRADWIVFTSAHAVDATCGHAAWQQTWRRGPARTRVAAIGAATAARLAERGVDVDLVPATASAAGLVAALVERAGSLKGVR